MGNSTSCFPLGLGDQLPPGICSSRSPGILGLYDHGDPLVWSVGGDRPGSIGMCLVAPVTHYWCPANPTQRVMEADTLKLMAKLDDAELELLAAVAYGEASTRNLFEEMAGIANVIVRQKNERNTTLAKLLGSKSSYAFAASDGNARVAAFRKAKPADRLANAGMAAALEAAENALNVNGYDYSKGGYFWDGADIKSNYAKHPKVLQGIKFTEVEHNIYDIKETKVSKTIYWLDAAKKPTTRVRGSYEWVYESTAAYGGTIFWKYGADFLKATGNKPYN